MKALQRTVSLWLSVLLILTCVPITAVTAASASSPALTNDSIANGEYEVDFLFLEDGKTSASVSNNYMKIPGTKGKLIVEDGAIWFEHEITKSNYGYFEYLGYRPEGVPKAVIVDSVVQSMDGYAEVTTRDAAAIDRMILRYAIDNIAQPLDILMHINIAALSYNHWYNVQLSIDTSQIPIDEEEEETPIGGTVTLAMLQELITVTEAVYSTSVEGTDFGEYPIGSRAVLESVLTSTKQQAELLDEEDETKITALYATLEEALNRFRSLQKVADKKELAAILEELTAFLSTAKRNGEGNGAPGLTTAAILAGEYDHSIINDLRDKEARLKDYLDRPEVTQETIDNAVESVRNRMEEVQQHRYVEHEPLRIYVLDTNQPTNKQSIYADLIEDTMTTVVKQAFSGTMDYIRGNLTLKVRPDLDLLYASTPSLDGTYVSPDTYEQYGMLEYAATPWNKVASSEGKHVYQLTLKWGDVDKDTVWQGLGHITFYLNGEKRSLYLSFNRNIHEQLIETMSVAAGMIGKAEKLEGVEQADFDAAKQALQGKIDQAAPIADNLGAARPEILTAHRELEQALDTFKQLAKTGGTDEGEPEDEEPTDENEGGGPGGSGDNGDSGNEAPGGLKDGYYYISYKVYKYGTKSTSVAASYFISPAVLEVSGGRLTVSFTVTRSKEINGLKIRGSSGSVVETDTENNTRVVAFSLPNLDDIHDGWVRIDWDEYNYHHEYDIQFYFDAKSIRPVKGEPEVPSGSGSTPPPAGYVPGDATADGEAATEQAQEDEAANAEPPREEANGSIEYRDTERHWAKDLISRAVQLGFIRGYADGTFRPEQNMTRSEIAVLLSQALKLQAADQEAAYVDLDGVSAFVRAHIAAAGQAGLMRGLPDQTFQPNKVITRIELVVIIARAAGLKPVSDANLTFVDADQIPAWARGEAAAAVEAGLVRGKAGNRFDPHAPVTRAEAATLALRLLDVLGDRLAADE